MIWDKPFFSAFYQDPNASSDDGGQKWWNKESDCAEYEADIDIPLVFQGGSVMVADTEDVYSMPASSSVSITMTYKIKISSFS